MARPDPLRWVQPIMVLPTGSHEDTIVAAAQAAAGALFRFTGRPGWNEWLAGAMTKTVRRPDKPYLRPDQPAYEHTFRSAAALAYQPMLYGELPPYVRRGRVAGTNFRREGEPLIDATLSGPTLVIDKELTTGKAAAAASHAAQLWLMRHFDPRSAPVPGVARGSEWEGVAGWMQQGYPVRLSLVSKRELWQAARSSVAIVRDSGLTEVPPGTITAAALD